MAPALVGVGAAQISLLINTTIAGHLGVGSVTSLTLADRLMEFPTAMLGVALGTILLPGLAKANTEQDSVEYSALLDWGLRLTFLLALPSAIGLAVLAEPVMATLFNYGEFTRADTLASSAPLIAYSAGLIGIIVVKILTPAFFARQDFNTPVRIAIGVVIAVQLMNFPMVYWMNLGVAGLALSISMGACLNAGVMYFLLRKRGIFAPQAGWLPFFIKLVIAVAAMGAIAWFGKGLFVWSGGPEISALLRGGFLALLVGVCAMSYFAVLFVLGFRIRDFKRSAR
jgi:putative peptidoglycan lipid II flippase